MTQAATPEMFRAAEGTAGEPVQTERVPEGVPDVLRKLFAQSDNIAKATALALSQIPAVQAAARRAETIRRLWDAITDGVLRYLEPLINTPLGFKCDKAYDDNTLRSCIVQALLLGARLTDNEFNIIQGRAYLTREFFVRVLSENADLTNLRVSYGVPKITADGALVSVSATWMLGPVADSLDADIPIGTRGKETVDNILGKASRKFLSRVYARVTGSKFAVPEGEIEDSGPTPTAAQAPTAVKTASEKIEELRTKHAERAATTTKPETAPCPT